MGFFNYLKKLKSTKVKAAIIAKFYIGYPEVPYISDDRPIDWIDRAKTFPKQSIIPKTMMTRYTEGLLPGHVYMLYWLKKYTNKKVPAYFEYKYGIDFEKERLFLYNNGYLNSQNKPTDKGDYIIEKYHDVIDNHSQKIDRSSEGASKQILAMRDKMKKNGFKEYEYIANKGCCKICAKLDGKHFPISKLEIGVNAPPMHEGCCCSITSYSKN